jgi:hypothetical protein
MTKARRMIESATFDPDTLNTLRRAFDEAWAVVAGDYWNNPQSKEDARACLASIMIGLAKDGQLGTDQLKKTAIRLMRQAYASQNS